MEVGRSTSGPRASRWAACLLALGLLGAGGPAIAATTRIKLATLAPTGSVYHKSLMTLRDEWRKLSGGQVDLVVYADGKLGGEAQVVRLMGVNTVQAAMVTTIGLRQIEPAVEGLQSIPMGFRSFAEVDYVAEKLRPMLEQRIAAKGFVVLGWADAGWVRFFSTQPVAVPDDLRPLKLFAWAGSPEVVQVYRSAGFTAVALETADIVPGLETGLIQAVPCPPVFALKGQIDRRADHMLELNWAPLAGALVVRKATWDSLPAPLQPALLEAARRIAADIQTAGRNEGTESVKAMQGRGLKVHQPTPEQVDLWRTAAEAAYPEIRGKIVPADIFDRTLEILKEYRALQP